MPGEPGFSIVLIQGDNQLKIVRRVRMTDDYSLCLRNFEKDVIIFVIRIIRGRA